METDSLPSSADAIDVESLPSDVSSVHDDEQKQQVCCSAGCLNAIAESEAWTQRVSEIRQALDAGTKAQQANLQFVCLRAWQANQHGWRKYNFAGLPLCVQAATTILRLPAWKFKRFQGQIADGKLAPDQSLKDTQKQREQRAMKSANILLSWLHQTVAENLAETKRTGDKTVADSLTLMQRGAVSALGKDPLPVQESRIELFGDVTADGEQVKWLPPGTSIAEMKDLAQTFLPDYKVSYSTFMACYQTMWSGRLKIRSEGQHAKCATCARLKEYRRQCHSKSDINRVQGEHSAHVEAVMADRRFDADLNLRAQKSVGAVPGMTDDSQSLLSISMDAMDCAKFKVPRHLEASKEFQNSWRPELTMIGGIVEGLTEHYILADQDIVKNSDLQCTLIGLLLQESVDDLQARGKDLPRHLRIHTDNATGEGKNQTVFYLASWMVRRKLFESVTLSQFRVGHSHGKIDQRFSEVRYALAQTTVLEDPTLFAATIHNGVKPREGRALKVHHVGASLEFKKFFEKLELQTSGHTQTKAKTNQHIEACHVFNFTRRSEAEKRSGVLPIQELDGKYGIPPHPDDIILSTRLHLADDDESQAPFVFAAAADFDKLPEWHTICKSPRSQFSKRQVKEFEKTAFKISQSPWNLSMGSAYLLKLVTENQENDGQDWNPPLLIFLFHGIGPKPVANVVKIEDPKFDDNTFLWNHTTPGQVTVTRARPRLSQKMPAAAPHATGNPASASRPAASPMSGAPASFLDVTGHRRVKLWRLPTKL